MGSFDMACNVSGISMGLNQPVKMFFIVNPYVDDNCLCYPTGHYIPCSFGIDMVYDDYGNYTFDEQQPAWQEFLSFIREQTDQVPQGENEYHEMEFDPQNPAHFEVDYLFDVMYHCRLKLKPTSAKRNPNAVIYPFPIHKRVYDEICMVPTKDFIGRKLTKETIRAAIDAAAGETRQRRAGTQFEEFFKCERSDFLPYEEFYGGYPLTEMYERRGHEWLADNCAEMRLLFRFMMVNRIMFIPTMSAGQDFCYEENIAFHNGCVRIARDLKKKLKEDLY